MDKIDLIQGTKPHQFPIGIEIEEKYCEIAAKRCCQEVMEFQEQGVE